jgi:glutathione S-transferase
VSTREDFLKLSESLFPFKQMPVLQIDGHVLAQSQAIIRYLARRADIAGTSSVESVQIDMIAETINDTLSLLLGAPFLRSRSVEEWEEQSKIVRVKWAKCGHKLEDILQQNNRRGRRSAEVGNDSPATGPFLVGSSMSYADVLAAHLVTWVVEELGADSVRLFPLLVDLQHFVISLPEVDAFIKSDLYYPIGDAAYVLEVNSTLGR